MLYTVNTGLIALCAVRCFRLVGVALTSSQMHQPCYHGSGECSVHASLPGPIVDASQRITLHNGTVFFSGMPLDSSLAAHAHPPPVYIPYSQRTPPVQRPVSSTHLTTCLYTGRQCTPTRCSARTPAPFPARTSTNWLTMDQVKRARLVRRAQPAGRVRYARAGAAERGAFCVWGEER